MGTAAEDYQPVNNLTIAELDAGSRLLKADIVNAVYNFTEHRWQALAIVAYLLARRTDPAIKVGDFRGMLPDELRTALGYPPDGEEAGPVVYVERGRLADAALALGVERSALCAALDVPEPTAAEDEEDAKADPDNPTPTPDPEAPAEPVDPVPTTPGPAR